MSNHPSSTENAPVNNNGRRNRLLTGLVVVIALVALGYGAYYLLQGRWFESTEDAYANGNIIEVTPLISGTIIEITPADNMLVQAGQTLVKFDPNDPMAVLEQAEAALARTVRQVRGLYANAGGQNADLASKLIALERTRADVERRRGLETSGAIAREELSHAQAALESAERAVTISREQFATTSALIDGTSIATHPEVKMAAAMVRKAYLDHARTTLRAPVTGYVTQRRAQLGQHVAAGTPLMALVPLDRLWVDANFKETQLEHMRIGQPVEVHSDIYGSNVIYHGQVASIGIGTGSAMSLLPAQNATGNWIKIVQRVPVRISLDAKELNEHPLRIGMSMHVEVDIHDRSGPMLSQSDPGKAPHATNAHQQQTAEAEARVKAIIRANSETASTMLRGG